MVSSDLSGKLHLVHLPEAGPPARDAAAGGGGGAVPHAVFFDDNVERDRSHIVDVRDASTGAAVPFAVSNNR